MGLSFRKEDRGRVANGEITVTFRLWARAQVRAGNTYRSAVGAVEVDDVQVMPAALVSAADVALAGCRDVQAVWDSAGEHTGTIVRPETLLYRVQFRFVSGGEDPGDAPPAP